MDERKTIQALKQIFDQCGTDILQDRHRFESVLLDMLPGSDCKTERMLFQSALNSNALPLLLRAATFTTDAARRAVEQLQKDCFINEEAAKFIVRCVTAARGGDPKIVDGAVPEQPKHTPPKPVPEPPKPSVLVPEPYVPPEPPKPPEPYELAAIYSKMCVPGRFFNSTPQGNLHMYQDKMLFLPNKGKGQVEMLYEDVYEINTKKAAILGWTISMIAVLAVTAFWVCEYLIELIGSTAWFILFATIISAILLEWVVVWSFRRSLTLKMDYVIGRNGNRYRPCHNIWIFSPADKKQAVSIIKSKMAAHP